MTKAEIIRKLAKRVGVSDLDAKIFFEVFLKKVSLQLNPGETIKVKNFGYFQVRTGKIKNSLEDSESLLVDLILFFPLKNEQEDSEEILIFNIPAKHQEDYNLIDSYFSLSFGKPVIPLKDANVSEYFIPPTGNELRRLIDSKADKLLQDVEVVDGNLKGNEILLIDPDSFNPGQIEINWDEIDIKTGSSETIIGKSDNSNLTESETYSWDFSGELEKQIEEDALLDTGNEDSQVSQNQDGKELTWDFGEFTKDKEGAGEFLRVESVSSVFNIDHETSEVPGSDDNLDDGSSDLLLHEDLDLLNSINEELNEENFAAVRDDSVKDEIETDAVTPHKLNMEIQETFDEIPPIQESTLNYSPKRNIGLYVIFVLLFLLCGSVFLYLKFTNFHFPAFNKTAGVRISETKPNSVLIDRDFSIPVNYPYTKDSSVNVKIEPVDNNAFDKKAKNSESQNAQINQPGESKIVQIKSSSNAKVKEFIYKSGDKYLVQVSSWSSEKNALKHASYYNGKGYQTSIVKANLDTGTWYRVMVGYFNSEDEAEKFHNPSK
ncbi:MAG: SPOR domain-containing protein [Ignavibacteriaceae bacterium]|nr:SPOR domain-containing protein [Ignavibacteriaceae bacterium]